MLSKMQLYSDIFILQKKRKKEKNKPQQCVPGLIDGHVDG